MSKKLFVIFTQIGRLPPKLYKSQTYLNKLLQKENSYKYKQFQNENAAQNALLVYEMEHKKFKLNQFQKKIEDKIKQLTKNNTQNTCASIKSTKSKDKPLQSKKKISSDDPSQKKKNKPQNESNKKISLEELKKIKQSLYHLTPCMQKLLYNYTPTFSFVPINPIKTYTGFFDGCSKSNPGPAGVGYYIVDREQTVLEACWPLGNRTNNQSELTALLYLLVDAYINKIKYINVLGDSKLAIDFANKKVRVSHPNIMQQADAINKIIRLFPYATFQHIQRKYNSIADKLSNQGLKKKFQNEKFLQVKI